MNTLAERIAWAIETIKEDRELDKNATDEDLAGKLGTNKNTIGDYRKKKGLIKGVVLERLASVYRFNPGWLLEGKGEPFAGARARYPEVCDMAQEEEKLSMISESRNFYGKPEQTADQHVRISESVRMAIEVLESGLSYSRLLQLYIQQLYEAVRSENWKTQIEEEQGKLGRDMQSLEEKLRTEFSRELSDIEKRIQELKNGGQGNKS